MECPHCKHDDDLTGRHFYVVSNGIIMYEHADVCVGGSGGEQLIILGCPECKKLFMG